MKCQEVYEVPELCDEKVVEKEKTIVIRFSTTNEMSVKSALKMLIDTHEEKEEDKLREAR